MEQITLKKSGFQIPDIAVGCMRINEMSEKALTEHIIYCVSNGLNFFDHADIYGSGECEEIFGNAFLQTGIKREDIIIQSKCGIVPGKMYDLSKKHITDSVDNILKRLKTDYLDILLLHRPDALIEPEETAEAFDELERLGKVRHFGVSNHKPMQIELLKKYVKQEIEINQLQFSLPVSNMVANGLEVNMNTDGACDRDGSVLDYCRLNDITIQAWSPFQYGFFEGVFIGNNEKFFELNNLLTELSEKYGVTETGIAAAWILRHPANIQIITGSKNAERIDEIIKGSKAKLSREDWYRLYISAGHILP